MASKFQMMKHYIFIFLAPLFLFGQKSSPLTGEEETKVYTKAIAEYLKAVNEKHNRKIDTLFIGPYEYHEGKTLPQEVLGTKICMPETQEEGERKLAYRNLDFVNIVPPETKPFSKFIFIRFLAENSTGKNNWWPIHNCYVNLVYDSDLKDFKLEKLTFEYNYNNKYSDTK